MTEQERASLINDRALASMRDEMRLQAALDRPAWVSVHSHHFFDLRENQWRELDAVASRIWSGMLGKRKIRIKVLFLVESKSLVSKHLLMPEFVPVKHAVVFDWLGTYPRKRERFAIYEEAGLEARLAARLDSELISGASDVMPNAPNILLPPRSDLWHSAGFIEEQNSSGAAKKHDDDLRKSVVWRARLALQSAAKALAQTEVDDAAGNLRMALQLARVSGMAQKQRKQFDLISYVISEVEKRPFTITVFHPIVVVDSDLWGVRPDEVIPVEHARIHLTGISRYPYFWFDLVRRRAVDNLISEAQEEYDFQAEERGLEPEEQNTGIAEYDIAYP